MMLHLEIGWRKLKEDEETHNNRYFEKQTIGRRQKEYFHMIWCLNLWCFNSKQVEK